MEPPIADGDEDSLDGTGKKLLDLRQKQRDRVHELKHELQVIFLWFSLSRCTDTHHFSYRSRHPFWSYFIKVQFEAMAKAAEVLNSSNEQLEDKMVADSAEIADNSFL